MLTVESRESRSRCCFRLLLKEWTSGPIAARSFSSRQRSFQPGTDSNTPRSPNRSVPLDRFVFRLFNIIHQCCSFTAKHIIDLHRSMTFRCQLALDCCGWIKGIWKILLECKSCGINTRPPASMRLKPSGHFITTIFCVLTYSPATSR